MNSVATVSQISGEAYVERNGQKVALQQGDPVFVADTVLTSAHSKLELHFADDAVISLGASTKIAVQDFAFDPQGKTPPSFALEMLDGLVRSVSGKVVEQNPEAFKLSSPLGTVGIRGTETLHHITMKYEVHTVVNMETGHTVVITTPDGRQVIIAESLKGVTIFQDNPGPLNPYNVNPNEIEGELKQTFANDDATARPMNGFFVLADSAFLSAFGANHVEGGPAFVSGAQIQSLFGALNNFMTSLGYAGLSHSLGQFGSGITNYSDYSGSLVGSIGRMLAYGNAWSWSNNTSSADLFPVLPPPTIPVVVPSAPTAPTVTLGLQEGPYYFNNNVLENDPFGIQCKVELSAPTAGKPIILAIGGSAVANIHYDQTIGVGNVITNWGVFESGASMAPSPASMFAAFSAFSGDMPINGAHITWLGDGKIAIHLPPGVTSFYFKVPLIDTEGQTQTHTFTYTVVDGGGYSVTNGATGSITIVPDSLAVNEGWVPPKPTDPDYADFITNPERPGPKGPVVWLEQAGETVLENGSQTYTLHLDARAGANLTLTQPTTITLSFVGKNGQPITDLRVQDIIDSIQTQGATASYNASTGQLSITLPVGFTVNPSGSSTLFSFSAGLEPDSTIESGEQIVVGVDGVQGNGSSYNAEHITTEVVDIPTISVAAGSGAYNEGSPGFVDFVFTLSSKAVPGTVVGLNWSGAANAADFDLSAFGGSLPTSITIPAGATTFTLRLPINNDILSEGAENITLGLAPQPNIRGNYHVTTGPASHASTTLVDGTLNGPQLTLGVVSGDISSPQVAGSAKVQEDVGTTDGKIVFSLDINQRGAIGTPFTTTEEIAVVLTVTPKGTALYGTAAGDDFYIDLAAMSLNGVTATYDAISKELTLRIPAGYSLGLVEIPVVIVSDHIGETGEGFELKITSVQGNEASALAGSDSINTDIEDNSILASISAPTTLTEGDTFTTTVNLSGAPGTTVAVVVEFTDGLNTWQETVTFGATDTSKNITTFAPTNDQKTGSRNFSVEIKSITTTGEIAVNPAHQKVEGTVADAIDGPVFSLNVGGAATATKLESAGSVDITVNMAGTTAEAVDVVLSVSGTATYGVDYKWPAADPSGIPTAAELGLPSGFSVVGLNTTTGQLTIRVPANYSGGSFTVPATINNDTLTEGPGQNGKENFTVTLGLGTPSSAAPGSEATVSTTNKTATVTIDDDNNGPEISIAAGNTTVLENVGSTPFTVTLNSAPTQAIDLVLTLAGTGSNGAVIGTDVKWPDASAIIAQLQEQYPGQNFSITGRNDLAGTVTIRVPANFAGGSFTINATIVDNALTEANKQFKVSASIAKSGDAPGSEATIPMAGKDTEAITIQEDTTHQDGPKVQLVLCEADGTPLSNTAANAIAENGGKVFYKLQLVNDDGTPYTGARQDITVSLNVTGGSGLRLENPGTDITFANGTGGTGWNYNASTGTITVTIPAGANSVTFTGTAQSDTNIEVAANETVALEITGVTNNEARIDTANSNTTTSIQDAPTVSVAAGKAYYSEGASPSMDFTFTLTSPALEDTVIYFTCTPGAGLGLTDFTGLTAWPTSITILKGQTSATLSLPINNDALTENNEALTITLNAQGNTSGLYHLDTTAANTAIATIVDDTQDWNEAIYGPKPNGHGAGQVGAPIVRLTPGAGNLNTGAEFDGDSKHAVVNEDDINAQGSTIYYKLDLVDASGNPHVGAVEAITVVIDVTLIGGATYGSGTGNDFYFDLTALRALAGVTSATYDTTTHKLTLVLAAGTSSINIPVKIVPDQLTEKDRQDYDDLGKPIDGTQKPDETFTLKVSSVSGGEARVDTAKDEVNTTIDEVTQGIQVSLFQISGFQNGTESDTDTERFIKIGLKLSQASDEPVVVVLKQTLGDGSFTTLRFVIEPSDGANLVEFKVPIAINQQGGGNGTGTEGYKLEIDKVIGGEASIDTERPSVSGTITDNMDGPKISIAAEQAEVHESKPNTTAPNGTTTAKFTVTVDGDPVEPIDIVLNINLTNDAKWLSFDALKTMLADQGCTLLTRTDGQLVVRVPAGFGSNSFTVELGIVDDNLTEGALLPNGHRDGKETLTVSVGIVRSEDAPGSEATIKSDAEGKASTTIIDDSKEDSNLDGPFLHLFGTRFVSESGATPGTESYAQYQVVLRDANGQPAFASETITMRLTYAQLVEMGYAPAVENQDYERLDSQYLITIQAGQSVSNIIKIRIADDRITENNEGFVVAIDPATVTGGEARIANPEDVKVKTIIVDDTKAWPGTTGQIPNDGFLYNEVGKTTHGPAQLDGPHVSLTGSYWVAEPGQGNTTKKLDFILNLDAAPEQDVLVTMGLTPAGAPSENGKGFDLIDLFGTNDIAAINAQLAGSGVSNFRVNPAGGWLFDVTAPAGRTSFTFKLPLQPDDITETNCRFTTSIVSVEGSEARVDTANNSLTTTITDESPSTGPSIVLKVLDYDGSAGTPITNETGQWEQNATLPGGYTPGDKPASSIYFQVSSSRPVVEDTLVSFKLYNRDGSPYIMDPDTRAANGATWNAATQSYSVTIRQGQSTAEFSFPKKDGADYYRVQLVDSDQSESVLDDFSKCVSEVEQSTTGGTTHRPSVSLGKVDNSSTDADDTATSTKEGHNATFKLHVNETTTEDITVTIKITGLSPTFNMADMGTANGLNMIWVNQGNGTFKVTIPSGTAAGDILFTLPIAVDATYEGTEAYMLSIINTEGKAWIGSSARADIIDSIDAPTLSLVDKNTVAGEAQENTHATYRLVLDKQPLGAISVTLKYTPDSGTQEGQDYSPVKHVNIAAGEWTPDGNGKWYYIVTVPLPDDQIEGNKGYQVEIESTTGDVLVDAGNNSLHTEITDYRNGPTLNFVETTATIDEAGHNGDAKFELVLTRPAAQMVTVKLLVTGTATEGGDYDLSALAARGYTVSHENGKTYLTFTIPQGQLKAVLDLNGIFNNDKFTEGDETIELKIVETTGGEVLIGTTKDATVTIEDTIDGGEIQLSVNGGNAFTVNESALGTGSEKFIFTFTLEDGPPEQDVEIWFTFQGVIDNIPPGPHKITITKDSGLSYGTFEVPYSYLNNDHKDEQPSTAFKLVITDVTGNETQGTDTEVTVTVQDNDHKPVPVDDAIVVLVPPAPGTLSWRINVLDNDNDQDVGDLLRSLQSGTAGKYGSFSIDAEGYLTYTLDGNNDSVKKLTTNQALLEDAFAFKIADTNERSSNGEIWNEVASKATLEIKTATKYTGTNKDQWIMGSDQAEDIDGGGGTDKIHAGAGNDTLRVNADGKGFYYGEAGDDLFVVPNLAPGAFGTIDGGSGTDTIALPGTESGKTLDFTGWTAGNITNVEVLDITGGGDNTLNLDGTSLAALNAQAGQTLRINGNNGDKLALADFPAKWANVGTIEDDYYRIKNTDNNAEVLLHKDLALVVESDDAAIDVTNWPGTGNFVITGGGSGNTITAGIGGKDIVNAGAGNDSITLKDAGTASNGTFDKNDIGKVDGGTGTDTLRFAGAAVLIIDFTTGLHSNIKNVEVLDLSESAGSILRLNGAAFQALATPDTGNKLYVQGGNTLELCNTTENTFANWQYASTDGNYYVLQWGADASKQLYVHNSVTLSIKGAATVDTINFAGYPGALTIDSGAGNDSITGGTGSGTYNGGTGNDTITGGTGSELIYGDAGTDVLRGGGGADTIHGGLGNDTLYNDSTQEALFGNEDNDTFILRSLTNGGTTVTKDDFGTINGGDGTDGLKLAADNMTLDLSGLDAGKIANIQAINLTDTGANHLVLDANTLTNMGIADGGKITVTGDAVDTFELQGTWTYAGVSGSNVQYRDANGCLVELPGTMRRVVAGAIALPDKDANGIITAEELGNITGKTGLATLTLDSSQNDTVLNLASIAANQITGINTIKLDSFGSNKLVIGENTLSHMGLGSDTLTVEGDTNDSFELQGSGWTFSRLEGDYALYTLGTATLKVHKNMGQLYTGTTNDDTFVLVDKDGDNIITGSDFARIEGNQGQDLLALDANQTGKTIDLSSLGTGKISGIEIIDLSGAGNNKLVLDENTLTNMGLAANETLTVYGTGEDSFELKGTGWNYNGMDNGYHVYINAAGQLLHVQEGLTRAQQGTIANETFSIIDTDTIGGITAADFASIHGGGGSDILRIDTHTSQDNLSLDLTGLGSGQITGIATVDLTGNGNNKLVLDANTIGSMGVNTLTVKGNAGDTFELKGSWEYKWAENDGQLFQDDSGRSLIVGLDMLKQTAPGTLTNTSAADYLQGTENADTFTLAKFHSGLTLSGADFGKVDGGEGEDTITFAESYDYIDLAGLPEGKLLNIEAIDLTGHGNNILYLDEATFEAGKHYTITGEAGDIAGFRDEASNWTYESLENGWANFVHNTNGTTVAIAEALMNGYTPPNSLVAPAGMAAMEGAEGYSPTTSLSEPLTGENTSSVLELTTFTLSGMDTIALHDGQKLHIDANGLNSLHEKGGVAMISGDETTEVVLESVTFFRTGSTVEVEGTQFEYCTFTAPDETEIQMLIQTTLLTGQAG